MIEFIERPANERSLLRRRSVCGVGTNDADYLVQAMVDGKLSVCPFYRTWTGMLERCYSTKYQKISPTYIGCRVCSEWLVFSNFKEWMRSQDWQGKQLDKDILTQGNKIYSPERCLFVTQYINGLLNDKGASRGKYPQGVCFNKVIGKFRARCRVNGKSKFIGYYLSPEEASEAYREFKYQVIADVAVKQAEPLRSALLKYKIKE